MTAIPARVRNTIRDRSGNTCEGCGANGPLELHHRKFRSRGGKHAASNIVALCGWGNHTGCHGRAHSDDPPAGWAVNSWGNPVVIPFLSVHGLVWLDDAGGVHDASGHVPF
jgi:hypothetical protein